MKKTNKSYRMAIAPVIAETPHPRATDAPSRGIKFPISIITGLCVLFASSMVLGDSIPAPANAASFTYDLGPLGPMNGGFDPVFAEPTLNLGTHEFPGTNTERLTVMFADGKGLLIEPDQRSGKGGVGTVEVAFLTTSLNSFGEGHVTDIIVGFVDAGGNPILSSTLVDEPIAVIGESFSTVFTDNTPFIAHGVFVDFDSQVGPLGYLDNTASVGFSLIGNLTVVPEPATLSLLAVGGLAMLRRKRVG
jgi:hypothetical protein